jgi:hypothetical protein
VDLMMVTPSAHSVPPPGIPPTRKRRRGVPLTVVPTVVAAPFQRKRKKKPQPPDRGTWWCDPAAAHDRAAFNALQAREQDRMSKSRHGRYMNPPWSDTWSEFVSSAPKDNRYRPVYTGETAADEANETEAAETP